MARQPIDIEFDGTENLTQIFEKLPVQYARKPVISAFRKAGRPLVNEIRRLAPGSFKKLIGVDAGRRVAAAYVGYKKQRGGEGHFQRTKAYWREYGTLQNRMQGYPFAKGVRGERKSWRGGIKPRNTVSQAWSNKANEVQTILDKELETKTLQFLNKHVKK